jgi:selenide,water dikinase
VPADERVLVDYRTADDAGVYRLDDDRALVQTVDFFTPIVDDPDVYGRIAAANALSDVYAMGGRPLTALAVASFPKALGADVVRAIFAGGLDVLRSAGVALLGGHTVQDQEVKFGYAVTGEVHPSALWTNAGARPGDVLLLTKPLGTGVVATAIKNGRAPQRLVDEAVASMVRLNRGACEALRRLPPGAVHACTDVTGFGLVGHASEVAAASGVTLEIEVDAVPLLDGVLELVADNTPGGNRSNAQHFGHGLAFTREMPMDLVTVLHDPQTSGGLLVAVAPEHEAEALSLLAAGDPSVRRIGTVAARLRSALVLR